MGVGNICKPEPLTSDPQVRQDFPASTVPRRQHNTFLCHTPRFLQTFLVLTLRKRLGDCAQTDRPAQLCNVAVAPLGDDGARGRRLAALEQ